MSKDVVVAVISGVAVIASAVIGGIFLLKAQNEPNHTTRTFQPGPDAPSEVDITITAEMSAELASQTTETVNVEIDGESKATLVMDRRTQPTDSQVISLTPEGHNYEIMGTATGYGADGNLHQYYIVGKGAIDVLDEENQTFHITQTSTRTYNIATTTYVVELEKV